MRGTHINILIQLIKYAMLIIGVVLIILSAFFVSSFLAILGVTMVFWGAILFYITPSKQVPLTLLNASTPWNASNIERILSELNLAEKGLYLPPKNLQNVESSLVLVRKASKTALLKLEEITEKLIYNRNEGVFLTPPGMALSQLFEKELGVSFAKTDLAYFQRVFPKLLMEDLEIAKKAEMQIQNNRIKIEIIDSILNEICLETRKNPRVHEQVGCLLTSAIACALAKVTGEVIIIEKETHSPDEKTTVIEYSTRGE